MIEITRVEFDGYGIYRNPAALNIFTEKRWFKCGALLGVVVFDHDGEWGWMLLAKSESYGYRGIDMGCPVVSQEAALSQLAAAFKKNEGAEAGEEPPMTREQAVKIHAQQLGISEERAAAGMDALRIPQPRNN